MADDNENEWMEDIEDYTISPKQYDITSSPNDFNVMTLVNFMESGAIVIPPYQRHYNWDRPRASKLIESLIIGLPVPQIFFYEESRNKFAILDGHQRLMSIYFFSKGRFPRRERRTELRDIYSAKGVFPSTVWTDDNYFEDFSLSLSSADGEAHSPLHDQTYEELREDGIQREFDLKTIRCVIVKQNEPKDDNSSVFEIFSRLNTGGVLLKSQEIRASLYHSYFYRLLSRLNKEPNWRGLINLESADLYLRDEELILRAFAMLINGPEYKPSMTRFLNVFSRYAMISLENEKVDFLRELFFRFLTDCFEIGSDKFQISLKFSIALFESAFFASCHKCWKNYDKSKYQKPTKFLMIELNEPIRKRLQEGTTKKEHVLARLHAAEGIWNAHYLS